jgi:acetyl-CoA acyltransferase 2
MSQAPHTARNIRFGVPLGQNVVLEDSLWLGLSDSYCKMPMALTAEKLGAQFNITRDEVDAFAFRSQQLWKAGKSNLSILKCLH